MSLPCGHNPACQYSYLDRGLRHRYCLACMFEKINMKEIGKEPQTTMKKDIETYVKECLSRKKVNKIKDEKILSERKRNK